MTRLPIARRHRGKDRDPSSTPPRSRSRSRPDDRPRELHVADRNRRDPGPPAPRLPRREVLCDVAPFQVRRAGRGKARWGRHWLASDGVEALRTVGSFGSIECADLEGLFENTARARLVLRQLRAKRLLRIESFRRGARVLDVASLTKAGKRLLDRHVDPRDRGDDRAQRYRASAARSAQVLHDVAVFRAARIEMDSIETRGGRVLAIRTDADLRRMAIRRAARPGPVPAKAEIAAALGLTVRNGSVVYPDVRIEYEVPTADDREAAIAYVDVEVATRDYRKASLRAKADAGFRIYEMASDGTVHSTGHRTAPAIG